MRDEETGTLWQQISGKGILGPLKGRKLTPIFTDELTFNQWRREIAAGRVLKPDPKILSSKQYAEADWEQKIEKLPVVIGNDGIVPPRTLMLGLEVNGVSKAYPFSSLTVEAPIADRIGGTPILLWLGEDKKSVRCFGTTVDGSKLELFYKPKSSPPVLFDSATASEWNFSGTATSGSFSGKNLTKIPVIKDYWFDWKNYHPETQIYKPSPNIP